MSGDSDSDTSTDERLLVAWRGGDRQAGAALFARHFRAVARFVRTKVASEAEVEDLVQATFLACTEGIERYRGEGSLRAYLLGIAYHKVLHYYARRRKAADIEQRAVEEVAPGPSAALARRAEERLLLAALRRLPLRYQVVIELYFWEELRGREIAALLDVPEGTVRTHLRRARLLLEETMRRLSADASLVESTVSGLETWARRLRDGAEEPPP
ncbi:MAG: RNA polymerase sigma factor [Nannocystaceae bacterium]